MTFFPPHLRPAQANAIHRAIGEGCYYWDADPADLRVEFAELIEHYYECMGLESLRRALVDAPALTIHQRVRYAFKYVRTQAGHYLAHLTHYQQGEVLLILGEMLLAGASPQRYRAACLEAAAGYRTLLAGSLVVRGYVAVSMN